MSGPHFLKVSINRGHATGKSLLLNEGALTFGSAPGNDFHLKLESIAEHALEIAKTLRGHEVFVRTGADIAVNGHSVQESHVLHDGDVITIGPFEFKVSFVPPIRDKDGKILTPVQIPIDVSVPREDEPISDNRLLPKEEIFARIRRPLGAFVNARFFFIFAIASIALLFFQKFRSPTVVEVEPEQVPMTMGVAVPTRIELTQVAIPSVSPVPSRAQEKLGFAVATVTPVPKGVGVPPTPGPGREVSPTRVPTPVVSRIETGQSIRLSPTSTPDSRPSPRSTTRASALPIPGTPTVAPTTMKHLACIDVESEVGKTPPESENRTFAKDYQSRWMNQIYEKLDSLLAGPSADSAVASAVDAIPGDWTRGCRKPNERSQECFGRVKEVVAQKFWEAIAKSQELSTLLRNPYRNAFETVRFQMRTEFLNLPGVEEANRKIFPNLRKEMMRWISLLPREAYKRDALYDRISQMGFEVAICTGSEFSSSYMERENRVRWCYRPESGVGASMIREFEIAELMARAIDYCRGMRILQSRNPERVKQGNQYPFFSVIQCLNSKRESLGFGFDLARARALDGCNIQEALNAAVSSWIATEVLVARLNSDKTLHALSQQAKLEAVHALVVRASSALSGATKAAYLEATLLAHPQMRKVLGCGGLSARNYCRF